MSYQLCIETPRTLLTPFTEADSGFIMALLNTPGWLQNIGDRNIHSVDDAKNYLNTKLIPGYEQQGFGFWKVSLHENNIPIGMCGFVKRDHLPQPDIGFAFLPEWEGQGYAFEAASAALHYGYTALKINTVLGITLPENQRSVRLLQRLGLRAQHLLPPDEQGEQLLLFSS